MLFSDIVLNLPVVLYSRRKITVFSTTLAAFTIEHGEAESSGSDLLVSFHDNDHYNSVHNNQVPAVKTSAKRKTPKKKSKVNSTTEKSNDTKPIKKQDSTVSTTTSMADLSVEDKKSKDVKAQDKKPKEGKPKEDKKSKEAKPKKNSECLCGSGLKYKKCCFAKEKHEARVQKLKENVSKNGDCAMEEDKDDDVVMKGNFRVLQI